MLPPPQTLGFGDPWAASRGAAALPRHKSHAHTSVLLISTFSSLRGLVYPPPAPISPPPSLPAGFPPWSILPRHTVQATAAAAVAKTQLQLSFAANKTRRRGGQEVKRKPVMKSRNAVFLLLLFIIVRRLFRRNYPQMRRRFWARGRRSVLAHAGPQLQPRRLIT